MHADRDDISGAFAEEGYVVLRQLLDPSVAAGVRTELSKWVDLQARQLSGPHAVVPQDGTSLAGYVCTFLSPSLA